MIRSRLLREKGRLLPKNVLANNFFKINFYRSNMNFYMCFQSFLMRKHFFNDEQTGFFKTQNREPAKSPMTGWYSKVHLFISLLFTQTYILVFVEFFFKNFK